MAEAMTSEGYGCSRWKNCRRGGAVADIAPDLVNPHEPGPECGDAHCYSHGVDESAEGAYRVCMECGHVYRTAEALRVAYVDEVAPELADAQAPPAAKIFACPYCAHDW